MSSAATAEGATSRRARLIGKGWIQGVALVMLFGFTVMGLLAYRTYTNSMPQPERVVTESGETLFTTQDITEGQKLFQARGLMEYGSILGHGGYLGPDFTAEYLRMEATSVKEQLASQGVDDPAAATKEMLRTNRYDPSTGTLVWTDEQVKAYNDAVGHYTKMFGPDAHSHGLKPDLITDPVQVKQVTAFFGWTAWGSSAQRPGHDYSYTNNWPPESLVGNAPTGDLMIWSVLSLIVLIGGTGVMFAIYGRWSQKIGWHSEEAPALSFRQPEEIGLTKSQRVVAWYVFTIAALFLVQTLLGALAEHYRADVLSFFGLDLGRLLPFSLARTWHVQLSLFWTAIGLLAAGLFLTPFIARREPRRQHVLVWTLFIAATVVVVLSCLAEGASQHGLSWAKGPLFSQQWEYLDLPFVFQVLLTVALFVWVFIIWRAMRRRLSNEHVANMPWLFMFAALAIPAFYAVGMMARTGTHVTVAEFWRFWVVHLWVEDFLELFTTVMVAYVFVLLGVVRERIALGIIFMDIILYSAGGVIGTMHHLYFSGTPVEHMALGAFFSAAEVIPLTFLTVEAWAFMQLGANRHGKEAGPFPHRWAVMFLMAVGFWNFLGAGVFGFLVNLPIVSYYEIGTALTANHAHASMMGVYGFMALALGMFALRYLVPVDKWPEKLAKTSFWSLNIGLAWMCFATLLPLGILQLRYSVGTGYFEARQLTYVTNSVNTIIEWGRMPGDLIFIIGGVLPYLYIAFLGLRNWRRGRTVDTFAEDALYEEIKGGRKAWRGERAELND
ncbi:nitric-oxide reductase large subunit [Actinomyces naeslundii]|uniref:Nitric-oxide reductase large subunit n=2 Tax=Actinomyces naeslundii TaxID=1655 RepID=A0A854D2W6_ACTNA|nr:cbb3-type cytochrome c oxidase subunit I [Actinomyces naeslundii]EJN84884.1 putative nitric oxide reductase, NorZ [Actinomyces naeslundii str. Howell 279]OMG26355.1 nitric-oxide reductase large subunit [Actinomyces naeslundii]OMG32338.1 nitric-oxide reductase large subunit [Actinomyces naeslundii]OMG33392.1 nitric-oxide reductase large subunit [Actinomyces naeslundii]OMG37548.1 nitric-oxide reductase large subunit [Actinomyces naeslundii]